LLRRIADLWSSNVIIEKVSRTSFFLLLSFSVAAWSAGARADGFSAAPTLEQARFGHTATLLGNGSVLAVGGATADDILASTELLAPASTAWHFSGPLSSARIYHTATLLASGKVLVAGGQLGPTVLASAEICDPATGVWSDAGTLHAARTHHSAVLLNNGQVMVLGGTSGTGSATIPTPELYDPPTNTWANAATTTSRWYETASVLSNGFVLVSGGAGSGYSALTSADVYNPAAGWIASVGHMITARMGHTATVLRGGGVLVAGGFDNTATIGTGEIYSSGSNSWLNAGTLSTPRWSHTATLLASGKVLAVAGVDANDNALVSAEMFDPSTNAWSAAASLQTARAQHTATLRSGGQVLVVGGQGAAPGFSELASCEMYTVDAVFAGGFQCNAGGFYGGGEVTGQGGTISATLVDQTGASVSNQPAYICGINICSNPATTASNGSVSFGTTLNMKKPAFKVGDTISYAEFAIPLTPGTTTNFGTLMTGKFPAAGSTLTPGADAVSGDVAISIPAGASIEINSLVYGTSDQQKLRTVRIPVNAQSSPWLPCASCGFQLLYGLAPSGTTLCPNARITVALPHQNQSPNDFGWTAGTAVEFWVMTTDTSQQYAPYAGWRKISGGVVSADGTSISTNVGEGFEYLDNFAVRLRP
jgi:Galactose oxidase, central domain/Kelch motif